MKRVLILLMLMSLLLAAGCAKKEETPAVTAVPEAERTVEAAGEPAAKETAAPETENHPLLLQVDPEDPAPGYILVQEENTVGFLPLPTEGEQIQEIIQTQPDGTAWRNVIRMTPEGFCMVEADCEGHDCIEEGEVTLGNIQDRLLWNMVICAPHRLTLCLYSPEEAAAMSRQLLGY